MKKSYGKGDVDWFQEARFGMFIHWGLYALPARHEWIKYYEKITDADYQKYFDHFNPDLFNPKEWARAAREAGMKYFVITAKHHEGFCLWDTKYTDYKITNTPFGRNALREIVDAFRGEGLHVGLYYSLIDWHHPEFEADMSHPWNHEKIKQSGVKRDQKKYNQYMRNQVEELLTEFGKIDIIWFDFSYPKQGKGHKEWESEKMVKLIRKLQPHILIDNRLDLDGAEDFVSPEQYVPVDGMRDEKGNLLVWEGCQTFSGAWGYHRDENTWKNSRMLIEMLVNHICKGGNLLLNVGPTARGVLDCRAMDRLQAIGEWMKFHNRAIYGCTIAPADMVPPEDCRYTYNPETRRLYVHIFAWPFKALHLPGMSGKVKYAQLLNDASEIKMRDEKADIHAGLNAKSPKGALTLELPIVQPDVEVPVIELFLK
ncbi:MAG: alpha-L-fucosidase [Victivallaceae bacterium]|jgi:alpha-L-fucosidase